MRNPLEMRNHSKPQSEYYQEAIMRLGQDSIFTKTRFYNGKLGAIYQEEATVFRLWSPTASQVELLLYDNWYGDIHHSIVMQFDEDLQIFKHRLDGDQHGTTYAYR